MMEFGIAVLPWQLRWDLGLAVLPGSLCWVVRNLSYRAPNRGAVCGIRWRDSGVRILTVSSGMGFRIMCRGILWCLCSCWLGRLLCEAVGWTVWIGRGTTGTRPSWQYDRLIYVCVMGLWRQGTGSCGVCIRVRDRTVRDPCVHYYRWSFHPSSLFLLYTA